MYYIKTTNHINIINAEPQAALSRSPCWLLQGVQSSLHGTCSPAHDTGATGADARVHVHICTHMYLDYPGPIHILQYTTSTIYTLSLMILYACLCAHSFRYSKFVCDDTLVFHCRRGTCLLWDFWFQMSSPWLCLRNSCLLCVFIQQRVKTRLLRRGRWKMKVCLWGVLKDVIAPPAPSPPILKTTHFYLYGFRGTEC